MTFKAYRPIASDHTHENLAFNMLHDLLELQWAERDEPLHLIGNVFVDGQEIDALILKRNALIVIDFKNYGGNVASIEKVADELASGEDDLTSWTKDRGSAFFLPADDAILPALGTVSTWVNGNGYEPAAVATFLQVADYWLVAHALAHEFTVVTHEVPETVGLTRGEYPISAEPWIIQSEAEYLSLSEGLLDDARILPFIVLTVAENSPNKESPLLDASALARATVGLARVVILPNEFTWRLTDDFGRKHSVFGGAVRVFLPGFSPDEPPYSHRLIVADRLSGEAGRRQCIDMMRQIAASESIFRTQINRNILTFAAVRNASLRLQQEQMGDATEAEQLVLARSRVEALEKELADNETVLNDLAAEQVRSIERAEAAEQQARTSAYRIQRLLAQLKEKGETLPVEEDLPATWPHVVKWIDENLAGFVVIAPRARKNLKKPQFGDIGLVVRCLTWLAETAHKVFSAGGGSVREAEVEEGIRNAHCGSDQFDFDWQGNKYTAEWHIKNGEIPEILSGV